VGFPPSPSSARSGDDFSRRDSDTSGRPIMAKLTKLERLTDRVAELELLVAQNRRPPSRFGHAIRYLIEHMDTIREIVAKHQSSAT
jgi:hypothetical protein